MIIGITGTLGAGKGTIAEFLVSEKGFKHFSVRDFLVEEIKKRSLEVSRDNMVALGNELRAAHGTGYVVLELYKKAQASGQDAVIESVRNVGEVEALRKLPGFKLWAVDADPKLRYERVRLRKSVTDNQTFEQFIGDEKREMTSDDPAKQNLSACIQLADRVFLNNGSIEEFVAQIQAELDR